MDPYNMRGPFRGYTDPTSSRRQIDSYLLPNEGIERANSFPTLRNTERTSLLLNRWNDHPTSTPSLQTDTSIFEDTPVESPTQMTSEDGPYSLQDFSYSNRNIATAELSVDSPAVPRFTTYHPVPHQRTISLHKRDSRSTMKFLNLNFDFEEGPSQPEAEDLKHSIQQELARKAKEERDKGVAALQAHRFSFEVTTDIEGLERLEEVVSIEQPCSTEKEFCCELQCSEIIASRNLIERISPVGSLRQPVSYAHSRRVSSAVTPEMKELDGGLFLPELQGSLSKRAPFDAAEWNPVTKWGEKTYDTRSDKHFPIVRRTLLEPPQSPLLESVEIALVDGPVARRLVAFIRPRSQTPSP